MKAFDVYQSKVLERRQTAADIYDIIVDAPEAARRAAPGQFAHIALPGRTLRRPISLCAIDKENGTLRFVFQVRGGGTEQLADYQTGDVLDVLAPLGTGFPLLDPGKKALLVGGGIGVPPLLPLAAFYGENAVAAMGFRNAGAVILQQDFERCGAQVRLATDDGTAGHHGLVTALFDPADFDVIYTCGPTPMLRAVAQAAQEAGVTAYVSLEERMACGVGACLGCACGLLDADGGAYYGHVCKDGPVFDSRAVAEFQPEGAAQT